MSDRGHAAVEFALAVGVLLLPAALAVLAFGPWSERRVAAEAIAAEAARATVLALDVEAGSDAAREQAVSLGIDVVELRLGWCGSGPAGDPCDDPGQTGCEEFAGTCPLTRGTIVLASVEVWTPLVSTPWGEVGGIWVDADHTEPIDLYRSLDP